MIESSESQVDTEYTRAEAECNMSVVRSDISPRILLFRIPQSSEHSFTRGFTRSDICSAHASRAFPPPQDPVLLPERTAV